MSDGGAPPMLHYCKNCGAVTSSPLVAQILDIKETRINELTHENLKMLLRIKIAEDMLKEVGAYLKNEQLFKAVRVHNREGDPLDEMVPTPAKNLADKIDMTLKEFKKDG